MYELELDELDELEELDELDEELVGGRKTGRSIGRAGSIGRGRGGGMSLDGASRVFFSGREDDDEATCRLLFTRFQYEIPPAHLSLAPFFVMYSLIFLSKYSQRLFAGSYVFTKYKRIRNSEVYN